MESKDRAGEASERDGNRQMQKRSECQAGGNRSVGIQYDSLRSMADRYKRQR